MSNFENMGVLYKELVEIITSIKSDDSFLSSENFIEDGLIDSFDLVMLITEIEKKFEITISGEDMTPENFSNIKNICNLIERIQNVHRF